VVDPANLLSVPDAALGSSSPHDAGLDRGAVLPARHHESGACHRAGSAASQLRGRCYYL